MIEKEDISTNMKVRYFPAFARSDLPGEQNGTKAPPELGSPDPEKPIFSSRIPAAFPTRASSICRKPGKSTPFFRTLFVKNVLKHG